VWWTQPVFVSSTFNDLQAERDYLRDVVFPAVEEDSRRACCHLEIVDLRWGVDTISLSEDEKEAQVLKVCLSEIARARPFLIVIVGDRYGWIPSQSRAEAVLAEMGLEISAAGKSVTAIEIECGALHAKCEKGQTFFYFRQLDYSKIPAELRGNYSDEFSTATNASEAARELKVLKGRICENVPKECVRSFSPVWDPRSKRLAGLEAWGEQLRRDLVCAIERRGRTSAGVPESGTWWDDEDRRIAEFVEYKTRVFVGRSELVNELTRFATEPEGPDNHWCVLLRGTSGSGKSSVWATVHRALERHDCVLLANAAGTSPRSGSVNEMLARWIQKLTLHTAGGSKAVLPDASWPIDSLADAFIESLAAVAEKKHVVCMVDALDEFEKRPATQHLTWIPRRWPPSARLLATTLEGAESGLLAQRPGIRIATMPPLGRAEAELLLHAAARRYHKTLHPEVVRAILDKRRDGKERASENPLWLSIAVETLLLLDEDDFAYGRSLRGSPEEQLHELILHRIHSMPATLAQLYLELADRARKLGVRLLGERGREWVDTEFRLMCASRFGLREHDLKALTQEMTGIAWDPLAFACFRRFLRAHLSETSDNRLWNFSHRQLRVALSESVFKEDRQRQAAHRAIGRHLHSQSSSDPLRETETMFHLTEAEDLETATRYFTLPDTADVMRGDTARAILQSHQGQELSDDAVYYASTTVADIYKTKTPTSADVWVDIVFENARNDGRPGCGLQRLSHRFLNDVFPVLQEVSPIDVQVRFLRTWENHLAQLVPNVPQSCRTDARQVERLLSEIYRDTGLRYYAIARLERALFVCELTFRNLGSSPGELIDVLTSFGDFFLQARPKDAISLYERGNELYEGWAKSHEGSQGLEQHVPEMRVLLGRSQKRFGDVAHSFLMGFRGGHMLRMGHAHMIASEYDQARDWFMRARTLSRQQAEESGFNSEFVDNLWRALKGLVELEWKADRWTESCSLCEELEELSDRLIRRSPAKVKYISHWADACLLLARAENWRGHVHAANHWLEQGIVSLHEVYERVGEQESTSELLRAAQNVLASFFNAPPGAADRLLRLETLSSGRMDEARKRVRAEAGSMEELLRDFTLIRRINAEHGFHPAAQRIDRTLAELYYGGT